MKKCLVFAALGLAGLLAPTACQKENKATDRTFQSGDTVLVKMGETASLLPDGLDIRLDSITDDSRCPMNALILCVWEGAATGRFTLTKNSESETGLSRTLGFHGGAMDSLEALGFRLRLIDLDPYPLDVPPIPQADYVAKLVVEKI